MRMKTLRSFLLLVALALASLVPTFAATEEQIQAIKDFEFQGMKFGTDVQVFRQKFPNAELDSELSEPTKGIHVFNITGIKGTDLAILYFVDKSLYRIAILYSPETLSRVGGGLP